MKYFHVNKGLGYAQPYESDYAILRRCLVANPGIPISALKPNLREHFQVDVYDYARNIEHDIKEPYYYQGSIHFQCPECAKVLYHTDIYTLPWLLKCPIHHIKLTKVCPTCRHRWPNINELGKRDCPTCGVTPLKTICSQVLQGIKSMDYQSIEKIYTLIHGHGTRTEKIHGVYAYKYQFDLNSNWCRQVHCTDAQFASFRKHEVSGYTENRLDSLHIQHSHVQKKYSKIIKREILDTGMGNYFPNPDLYLRWFYIYMKEIIRWINHHAPQSHTVHLTDYRQLDLYKIIRGKKHLCPYCSAFSLWFYYNITQLHNNKYPGWMRGCFKFPSFDFMDESHFLGFHDLGEPNFLSDNGSQFQLQKSFNKWFYHRGLTISFLDILRHLFLLIEKINISLSKKGCFVYLDHKIPYAGITDEQLVSCGINDGKFVFLYMINDPLNEYEPPKTTGISRICKTYHKEVKRSEEAKYKGCNIYKLDSSCSQYEFYKLVYRIYNIIFGPGKSNLKHDFKFRKYNEYI